MLLLGGVVAVDGVAEAFGGRIGGSYCYGELCYRYENWEHVGKV